MVQAVPAADATSAATAEGGLISLISDHTPIDAGLETVIYPNNMFFQRMILIIELGLAAHLY